MSQWFETWFDSEFYHKLYFDRDEDEASNFIKNLLKYFKNPEKNNYMLDVACGKGRHSITLANYGYHVTGIDISPSSIAFAKQFENNKLEFFQHDMRLTFRIKYYNYVFNLFTSFGYFKTMRENDNAIRTIAQSLNPNGYFVIDYLNTNYILKHLIANEIKVIDGTKFTIKREKTDTHFIKQIKIEDSKLELPLNFQEKVAAISLKDFELMFAKQNLEIVQLFGNYILDNYDEQNSPRLIIIAKKILS